MHLLNEALSLDRVPSTSLPVKVGQAPQCDHSLEYLTVVQHQTPPPPPAAPFPRHLDYWGWLPKKRTWDQHVQHVFLNHDIQGTASAALDANVSAKDWWRLAGVTQTPVG